MLHTGSSNRAVASNNARMYLHIYIPIYTSSDNRMSNHGVIKVLEEREKRNIVLIIQLINVSLMCTGLF